MRLIKLTQGMFTIVSDCDFAILRRHKWYAKKSAHNWYACRSANNLFDGERTTIRMHRSIMCCPNGEETHHRDGCSLNNLRENLENMSKQRNLYFENKNK